MADGHPLKSAGPEKTVGIFANPPGAGRLDAHPSGIMASSKVLATSGVRASVGGRSPE